MISRENFQTEWDEIQKQLADASQLSHTESARYLKRQSQLNEILEHYDQLTKIATQLEEAKKIASGDDPDLTEIATSEIPELETKLMELSNRLDELTLPRDEADDRDAIVEIRAGAGGDEAGIFAGDLFRMYSRFAEKRGWRMELINSSAGEPDSFKEISFKLMGDGVFGELKFESGVHRVQRVPATEAKGRVHTSTATVAVLPVAEEIDMEIKPEDLRVDVFRASGHGGQSVNTTDSAVRITHLPTGVVVSCQDEKSQTKNKEKAMGVLRSRLLVQKREEEQAKRSDARRAQIGTGDRSEKIRTYNLPQDRLTDHRIKTNWHNLNAILSGELDEIIGALKAEQLKQMRDAS